MMYFKVAIVQGPSIEYVMLEGEGVREGVTVCDRGRGGKEHVTYNFFYHTYER